MWKITLSDGKSDRTLAEDIELVGGVRLGHNLEISSVDGKPKFNRSDNCDAVVLTLQQPLGHDDTLFDLYQKSAGFKLKLTLSVAVDDGNGKAVKQDILDVNISDLVPDDFGIDGVLTLILKTLTEPEVVWVTPPNPRTRRSK